MISGGLRGVKECPNAEEAYLRALAIREKKLGPDHPDVDWSLKNPGYLYYYDMRDYARAALLYERALAIREKGAGSGSFANLIIAAFFYWPSTQRKGPEAINLAGGGSTTMVIKNSLVNKPPDATGERPVSGAILSIRDSSS